MKAFSIFLSLLLVMLFVRCSQPDSTKEEVHAAVNQRILPATGDPVVLRTDFSNETAWKEICKEIRTPDREFGFTANVLFHDDGIFENFPLDSLNDVAEQYMPSFIFVVDHRAVSNAKHPILCLGLHHNAGKQFRVETSDLWNVENNLSTANVEFNDFCHSVDADGVLRSME